MPFSKHPVYLSLGFHVLFCIWLKTINCPGCRRADSDVNIWTVPLPNRLEISLTPPSQVVVEEGVALHPAESVVEAGKAIPNSLPTVPGLRFTALSFFSSGSGVFRYARKGRNESRLMPLHRWLTVLHFSDGSAEWRESIWTVNNAPGGSRFHLTLPTKVEAGE